MSKHPQQLLLLKAVQPKTSNETPYYMVCDTSLEPKGINGSDFNRLKLFRESGHLNKTKKKTYNFNLGLSGTATLTHLKQ
ncbi:hypothetical protein FKM82_009167 [Ascaphus truei]